MVATKKGEEGEEGLVVKIVITVVNLVMTRTLTIVHHAKLVLS